MEENTNVIENVKFTVNSESLAIAAASMLANDEILKDKVSDTAVFSSLKSGDIFTISGVKGNNFKTDDGRELTATLIETSNGTRLGAKHFASIDYLAKDMQPVGASNLDVAKFVIWHKDNGTKFRCLSAYKNEKGRSVYQLEIAQ